MANHFAFECECGKFVVMEKGYVPFEYDESEMVEFMLHCHELEIPVTSDGITDSYGFCNWCELTKN